MTKLSPERPFWQGTVNGLTDRLESAMAPLLAPLFPDHYREVYSRHLATRSGSLCALRGLPELTTEVGYVPLLLSPQGRSDTLLNVLDALSQSPRLLISGPMGAGKSTLLRRLAWEFSGHLDETYIQNLTFKLFGRAKDWLIPIWLDLRLFAQGNFPFFEFIIENVAQQGFPGAHKLLSQWLEDGKCIVLLDGLEALREPTKRTQIAKAVSEYADNIWVIATRPTTTMPDLPGFSIMYLRGMSSAGIGNFLERYLGAHTTGTDEILAACERNAGMAELAKIPLMLAAMCRFFRHNEARRGGRLPSLYDSCLETLNEWSTQTAKGPTIPFEDKLRILAHVAWTMQQQGRSTIHHEELFASIRQTLPQMERERADVLTEAIVEDMGVMCPMGLGSQDWGFLSPALQSYLAARWIVSKGQQASLSRLGDTPGWRDTIILAASLLSEPTPFLQELESHSRLEPGKWFLLANCIAETENCEDALRRRVSDRLFALLEDDDAAGYWQVAATAIAGMWRKQVKEHFVSILRSPDAETRRRAALTLGRLRQEWALPALGTAINDPEPSVRERATWALGYIPSLQTMRILPRALRSQYPDIRPVAARSLVLLGHVPELARVVIRELISACADESEDVPRLAEQALTQIGRIAVPQLTIALNDARRLSQRSRIARILGRLGDEQALPVLIEALLSGNVQDIEGYIEAVAGVGAKAVPTLIETLRGKDAVTGANVVAALVRIGAPAVQPLIEAIGGSFPEVRNAAVRALAQIGTPAIEPLIDALLHDERFEVRRRALDILRQIGASEVVAALIQALKDADPGVRTHATRYLGELGNTDAVLPLVEVLQTDESPRIRGLAIDSLGALRDPRAIPALILALEDVNLREAASRALSQIGQDAIEPLISLLHSPASRAEAREAAWSILKEVGARARPSDKNLFGLAKTYGQLHDSRLSPEEILNFTENLLWWPPGAEVHRSLTTVHALSAVCTLESIADCGATFDWMAHVNEWFRPHIRDILRGFQAVVENIKLFRNLTKRDSQRDALLSSVDRLEEVQRLTQATALPFEKLLIERAASQWRTIILDTIKQLRGRASLHIELLTPRLLVRPGQGMSTIVFGLFNAGDSAARNLSLTLRPASLRGVEILGGETRELMPLGIGEGRQVEIAIVPNGARQVQLALEVHYDDDEREGVTQPFSCHIDFQEAPEVYVPITRSPYIAGIPIKTKDMFVGRQDIFSWIRDNLSGKFQENVLLLYGERRMGKTSVLYQLQLDPPPQHICLLFDLQTFSYLNSVPDLLFTLASEIASRLEQEGIKMPAPDWERFSSNPYRSFLAFVDSLDAQLAERRLLVMLDEFGVLIAKVRDHVYEPTIFDFLRGVIQRTNKLSFLFTGAYEVRRMQKDYDSILFNLAKVRKISYLTPGEATELIEKPMAGLLDYHPLVVKKIIDVTACHPYFIQYICDGLVQLARNASRNYVELTDLEFVLKDVVQDATGNIENSIYNYLGDAEKLALAALANVTDDVRVFVPLSDVAGILERRGFNLPRDELMQALKALEERDLITEMRIGQQLRYSFRMGLVRMWLKQNEMLLRLSEERGL